MSGIRVYLIHLFASFVFLAIFVNGLLLSKNSIKDILDNPENYFENISLSITDYHFYIIFILLITLAVLISYIFYLLLTFNSRTKLRVWEVLKSTVLAKEQFEGIYNNAPIPYITIDKNAEIHNPNKSTLRFFEVVPEEINGKNIFSFISNEQKEKAEKLFQYYKSKIPINREEVLMITKNGLKKYVLLSIFRMRNYDKFGTTGLVTIFDITEQKLLDKAKTEFVSLASHQLRTPLATTKWYTEMLISGDIGELTLKQKEYINRLYIANQEMIELVDVLLNVSRIEMGSLKPETKITNIQDVVESIILELTPQIEKKNINITKKYNDLLSNIKTDPKLLRIVIHNLISNSVKYTPEGGNIIIIFEQSINENKIIISDNGVGIPKNQQDKIFTKMFRADNVKNAGNNQGTGLGLYLVKSIIESMGGSIGFISEENKGTEFTIIF